MTQENTITLEPWQYYRLYWRKGEWKLDGRTEEGAMIGPFHVSWESQCPADHRQKLGVLPASMVNAVAICLVHNRLTVDGSRRILFCPAIGEYVDERGLPIIQES